MVTLGGFDHNQTNDVLQGFQDYIMNVIGRDRGGRMGEVQEVEVEGMQYRCEATRDDMLSKMIEELYRMVTLGGFDHNQTNEVLQGFQDYIMNVIGRDRGGRRGEVQEVEVDIGVPLRRSHIYTWGSVIHLLKEGCKFLTIHFIGLMHTWL